MSIRSTQDILSIGVLAFALWLYPGPAGAQQNETTKDCVDGVTTLLNYGDNALGCTIDVVSDSDPFIFDGAAGTSVRVNVGGATADLDPRVEVRDLTNNTVLADQSCTTTTIFNTCSVPVDLDLTVTAQYVISVSDLGLDNTGDYAISLSCLYGSCPGSAWAEIAYDAPTEEMITPRADMDVFSFQGAAGTSVRVNVAGITADLDFRVEVRDPTGAVLDDQSCTSTTIFNTCSVPVDLDLTLTGQYVIAVTDSGLDNTGDYSISLNCLYGSCPGGTVPEIFYDDPLQESITSRADMDVFSFQGAAGTSVRVNVAGITADLDFRVEVRDPTGAVLGEDSCTTTTIFNTCSVQVDLDLALEGQYLIAVSDSGLDNTGDYSISLNCAIGISCLIIEPGTDFELSGLVGGPFDPNLKTYTLTNNGITTVDFTASASRNFVTLSQTSGTLLGGASTTVEVSINANANILPPGTHEAKVDFINATNGQGNTDRVVQLTVKCPGSLKVAPGTAYRPSGPAGGPFAPVSKTYTLSNALSDVGGTLCGSDIDFSVEAFGNYISLSPTSGTLEPDGTKTVTVSLNDNANGLSDGSYNGTVTFTNTTFNLGDTERGVTLIVEPTIVDPARPWSIVPLLDLLLGPDKPDPPDSP